MILKVNGGNGVWISINGGDKSFASGGPGLGYQTKQYICAYCKKGNSMLVSSVGSDEENYVVTANSRFDGSMSETVAETAEKCAFCSLFTAREHVTIYSGGRWW